MASKAGLVATMPVKSREATTAPAGETLVSALPTIAHMPWSAWSAIAPAGVESVLVAMSCPARSRCTSPAAPDSQTLLS